MGTELLFYWAQFHNMGNIEKRQLFSQLIAEELHIHCEAHIYRVLTRLAFQTLRQKYEEQYQFTQHEQKCKALLEKLQLPVSTVLNWYYYTIKEKPLYLSKNECSKLITGNICECCIGNGASERLRSNYDLQLASKRLYQILVRIELFKDRLLDAGIILSDEEIRKSLRRIVEYDYYQKRRKSPYQLQEMEEKIKLVLTTRAITVLRWFYLLGHHPELLKKARLGEITPDDIFDKSALIMSKELRGGIYANGDVSTRS